MTKFAAFIITYEREEILADTIAELLRQTYPPDKVLIVDNSSTTKTYEKIASLNNFKVTYHKVGYNSGPAGAAAIGLKILAQEGYDWIYWGDDNDPPFFEETFELLLNIALQDDRCGCVGTVGQFFNPKTGFMIRVKDEEIQSSGILEVDNIAGNMSKIVNGKMIRECAIFPDEKLFFGFEELDFDIQINKCNYKLLVDKAFYLKHRLNTKRRTFPPKTLRQKSSQALQREYYSIRNTLYLTKKNKLYSAHFIIFCYFFIKQLLRFGYGFKNGYLGFKVLFFAFYHFITGKMGYQKIKL